MRNGVPRHVVWWVALLLIAAAGLFARVVGSAQGTTDARFVELAKASLSQIDGELVIPGLRDTVEVIRDRWGIPHIYARNTDDLFFAQGYVQAQDRLWQMELWRRYNGGRLAEIVGPQAVGHDRLLRLIQYQGPWDDTEFTSYHPQARQIFTAFANGVNAYIEGHRGNLPVEFKLTGISPAPWTLNDVVLRVPARSLASARSEIRFALAVARLGAAEATRRSQPDPFIEVPLVRGLDMSIFSEDVLDALGGSLPVVPFPRPPLLEPFRGASGAAASLDFGTPEDSPGSNNWVVSGQRTASGAVILANDPHRQVTNPSLRYIVHLNAPGWDVVGATEPAIPGVAIGHNGRVGWGITIVGTDYDDVFVEELNPENPNQAKWQGQWYPLRVVDDTIQVRGETPRTIQRKYSRHGPVFFEDRVRHRAYALRSTLQERGTAEYLGALRLNQATLTPTCREFLQFQRYLPGPLGEHDLWRRGRQHRMACLGAHSQACGRLGRPVAGPRDGRVHLGRLQGRLALRVQPGTGLDCDSQPQHPSRGLLSAALLQTRALQPFRSPEPAARNRHGTSSRGLRALPARHLVALCRGGEIAVARVELGCCGRGVGAPDHPRMGWPLRHRQRRTVAAQPLAPQPRRGGAAAGGKADQGGVGSSALRIGAADQTTARLTAARTALEKAVQTLRKSLGPDRQGWRWGRLNRSEFPHPLLKAYDLPGSERDGGGKPSRRSAPPTVT